MLLWMSGVPERTDRWWFDTLAAAGAEHAPMPPGTAMVLIDEQSLSALGQAPFGMRWPWPRTAFAALIAGLEAAGAERIVIDLVFFEQSAAAEQDALLGALAAGLDTVVLAALPDRLPSFWHPEFLAAHPAAFARHSRWGLVHSSPDADGVIREYLPAGSLAAAALGASLPGDVPTDTFVLVRWRGNLEQLRARELPMLPAAPFVVAGWGMLERAAAESPDLDPAALAAAITAEPAPPGAAFDQVRGRTVFVGANAAATFDAIATPLGAPEPGIVLHWNAYASLAAGDSLAAVPGAVTWASAFAAILCLHLFGRAVIGLRRTVLAAGLAALAVIAGSAALYSANFWFAPAVPLIAVAAAFTAVMAESFRVERARKLEITGWFGAYVSPAVVERLVADPAAIELGGEMREVTVLFSDIAGFTTLSERLPPVQLVALVNRFLEEQTEHILEVGGYLDKYIGDAVMAVFGSPQEIGNHALAACRAALACHAALARFNEEIERESGIRLGLRTGINTGEAVVGNVGSPRKKNYTVLGDAVNLASRLEGANKQTGTAILLGPITAGRVAHAMVLRPVARLQVKGKTQALEVFELLTGREEADTATTEFALTFGRGFGAYCGREFGLAAEAFAAASGQRPDDVLSRYYLEEAQRLALAAPGPEWNAVLKLESK